MLIDTHCHPFLQKEKEFKIILNNFINNWWKYLISIWTNIDTSIMSVLLSNNFDNIYSTIWIHPCHINEFNDLSIKTLIQLYNDYNWKIIWIWECWYDYFHIDKNKIEEEKENQRILFEAQIILAKELWLPIIVHSRKASEDTLNTLRKINYKNFLIHSFSENLETAQKYLDFSPECKFGINWIITFKNAIDIQETVKNIPLKNILIETDSPYLTPTPFRWKEENEPIFIKYILEKIIELRNENRTEIKNTIYKNSIKFFKL